MINATPDPAAGSRLAALGRAIRRARGSLTQAELGSRLGLPQTTISRWEQGTVDLGVGQVHALRRALGLRSGRTAYERGYAGPSEVGGDPIT